MKRRHMERSEIVRLRLDEGEEEDEERPMDAGSGVYFNEWLANPSLRSRQSFPI